MQVILAIIVLHYDIGKSINKKEDISFNNKDVLNFMYLFNFTTIQ